MKRLYWTQPDVIEAEVEVVTVGPNQVTIDPILFHPDEGGQPADRGTIGEAVVQDVQVVDGKIVHTLDRPLADGKIRRSPRPGAPALYGDPAYGPAHPVGNRFRAVRLANGGRAHRSRKLHGGLRQEGRVGGGRANRTPGSGRGHAEYPRRDDLQRSGCTSEKPMWRGRPALACRGHPARDRGQDALDTKSKGKMPSPPRSSAS